MSTTIADIRAKLHEYIDTAEDKKIEALYVLLEHEIEKKYTYSESELNMLHERAERYLRGEVKAVTVEESIEKARAARSTSFITDENGERISAVLPIKQYEQLVNDAEELADIEAFDKASRRKHDFIPLEDGLKQIEALRKKKK